MFLEKINLLNFKNYEMLDLDFSSSVNCIVGDNGSGKTNLLDAIYYLSMSKGAFGGGNTQHVLHKEDFFMVKGVFQAKDLDYEVTCGYKKGQAKVFKVNQKQYDKISDHIGRFPVVLIAPNDTDTITEGSELRRKFFDSIISQLDKNYLINLIQYTHHLKQRNSLLKQFAERNFVDRSLIDTYNHKLIALGKAICDKRQEFITEFAPIFREHYQELTENKEITALVYQSQFLEEHYADDFRQALPDDLRLQRTTRGIHKDDYDFLIDDHLLRKFGSQGQQKSYIIALKLAHFDIIKNYTFMKPILLLDDIFDKLDDKRMDKLMRKVAAHTFGQIFITDARPERTQTVFEHIDVEKRIFTIAKGEVVDVMEDLN
ncbi:DNA replication/repair protein RecF [uncultured Microscilla sp.]|uniref:DNA replication/repair protein RecF n=1 Tax=uncultured Microscilla sp. TaxID=432653 RepID=UPI00261A5479|nr:DNA replication and repair protein RecF [uncultured Microscilla sp.]